MPLQVARVEAAPKPADSQPDWVSPRAAPISRHGDFPFPVKAFYIGAPHGESGPLLCSAGISMVAHSPQSVFQTAA